MLNSDPKAINFAYFWGILTSYTKHASLTTCKEKKIEYREIARSVLNRHRHTTDTKSGSLS